MQVSRSRYILNDVIRAFVKPEKILAQTFNVREGDNIKMVGRMMILKVSWFIEDGL